MTRFDRITSTKNALIDFLCQFNDVGFTAAEETCKKCSDRTCASCRKTIKENITDYLNTNLE